MTVHNVMIDLETLSRKNNALILSIGLAAFDEENVLDTSGFAIGLQYGYGHIEPDTVKWWAGQSQAAREAAFNGQHTPFSAALGFKEFLDRHGGKDALVWANSPSFDLVILKNWWEGMPASLEYPKIQGPFPVIYRNERDCRTMFAIGRELDIDTTGSWSGTAHNAVDDAANQARAVITIRRALKTHAGRWGSHAR